MRIPFRQGIIDHQKTNNTQYFLDINGSSVNFLANQEPTLLTFADRDKDYLLTEDKTVTSAWAGPFLPGVDYWLFWDLNIITGVRTFGHTLVQPITSLTPPASPVMDQHWFDLTVNQMKVWKGTAWKPVIRLFACKYEEAAILYPLIGSSFVGSQVGIVGQRTAGSLIYDKNGVAVRAGGQFFTTEDIAFAGVPTNAQLRIEPITFQAQCNAEMAAYTVVHLSDFNQLMPATRFDLGQKLVGVLERDSIIGDVVSITTEGLITNLEWDWSDVNIPIYIDDFGVLTDVEDLPNIPVGVSVDRNSVYFRNPAFGIVNTTSGSGGGGGSGPVVETPHNAIALETNVTGAPVVVNTANPPLPGQVLYAISPTEAIWKYITTEDIVLVAVGITISGPTYIKEGSTSTAPYTATVEWSDGSFSTVSPTWSLIHPDISTVTIDGSNYITVGTTPTQTTFDLKATFVDSLGTTVTATNIITVIVIDSLTISGPITVWETESANYTSSLTWSSGLLETITTITTWSEDSTYSTIDSTGFFSASAVNADEIVTVGAEYSYAGKTVNDTKIVTIYDNYVQSLSISGPTSLDEKTTSVGTYLATATWRKGNTLNVTNATTWSLSVAGSIAVIDTIGVVDTFAVIANTPCTVMGEYTSELVTVNGTKAITIIDVPPPPRYGVGSTGQTGEAFILALPGELPDLTTGHHFTMTAGAGQKMYFAHLASVGTAVIEDLTGGAGFTGGWDASGNPGPSVVNVTTDGVVQQWYLYETDNAGLGTREYRINQYV